MFLVTAVCFTPKISAGPAEALQATLPRGGIVVERGVLGLGVVFVFASFPSIN